GQVAVGSWLGCGGRGSKEQERGKRLHEASPGWAAKTSLNSPKVIQRGRNREEAGRPFPRSRHWLNDWTMISNDGCRGKRRPLPDPRTSADPVRSDKEGGRSLSDYVDDGTEAEIASLGAQKQVAGGALPRRHRRLSASTGSSLPLAVLGGPAHLHKVVFVDSR